jgi:hypothetical protein
MPRAVRRVVTAAVEYGVARTGIAAVSRPVICVFAPAPRPDTW